MSLATGFRWSYKNIHLIGYSVAGTSTSIAFPEADVCFDVAQGLPFQLPYSHLLITHGHMDHASGLPYVIAQKAMMSQAPPKIYVPDDLLQPMKSIMRLYERIDRHQYAYQFCTAKPQETYPLQTPYFFKTFATFHRVPSQGYTIYERKKRLKAEYKDIDPRQLGNLRKGGAAIEEQFDIPVLSFSGDSRIEFLDQSEDVRKSRVLVMEVTYWDQKKSVANAREWGHIHIDELLPRLDQLSCEKIVLVHASARYSTRQINEIIDARVPEHHKHRIDLFPRPI